MNFTTPDFALFLAAVFLLHWFVFNKNVQFQNGLLFMASVIFYSLFDWKFTPLLLMSIIVNFYLGRLIDRSHDTSRQPLFLLFAILFNIALLIVFKYLGAFHKWNLIIPVGISFYTFQVLGYIIDIYNRQMKSCEKLLLFATYVSYFPKIIAGPIESAKYFLPQAAIKRSFNYRLATDGMRQLLWGIFLKLVIANNCATFSQFIFADVEKYPGSTLLLGAFFSIIQIYTDFNAYSNMAIGISKLFDIQLSRNFRSPFLATSIRDYWQRWHITLTSWMMKNIFTPLTFYLKKLKKAGVIIAVITTFTLVGLWHGANWTFIIFGFLHGLYFIPLIIFGKSPVITGDGSQRNNSFQRKQKIKKVALFVLVMLTAIFFASNSVESAILYFKRMFSISLISTPVLPPLTGIFKLFSLLFFISIMFIVEWLQQNRAHELEIDHLKKPLKRRMIYLALIAAILLFGSVSQLNFLYAQF